MRRILFAADDAVRRAVISRRSEKSTRGTGDIAFTLPRDIPTRRVEGWYFSRAFLAEERRVAPKEKPSVHGAVVSDCSFSLSLNEYRDRARRRWTGGISDTAEGKVVKEREREREKKEG